MKSEKSGEEIFEEMTGLGIADENELHDIGVEPDKKQKYLVVVVYDITDDKRRTRMARFLNGYGLRVQRSCFECILDIMLYKKLIDEIDKYISDDDLLRVYRLTGNMEIKTWGIMGKLDDEGFVIV